MRKNGLLIVFFEVFVGNNEKFPRCDENGGTEGSHRKKSTSEALILEWRKVYDGGFSFYLVASEENNAFLSELTIRFIRGFGVYVNKVL